MRSSSGEHFVALDHVRALAVLLVVAWHFTHEMRGAPIPFQYVPAQALFPFSLLDEGHTGVALFMSLSGYLFAKLLDGKTVDYWQFLRNRVLRLAPLLAIVIVVVGIRQVLAGWNPLAYAAYIGLGLVFPTLPNGGWSITAELHFYVVLPLLLWLIRRSALLPILVVVAALALRAFLYHQRGEVQSLAYWTILGRIDQFVLGMLAWHLRTWFARRHALVAAIVASFCLFYWDFDRRGGFHLSAPSSLWIYLSTLEGAAYAIAIAWYDNSFSPGRSGVSGFVARIGQYSYSIYLLHFFLVFDVAWLVHVHIMDLTNFYVACLWSVVFLLLMTVPGHLSFRYIESPFLARRRRYVSA